MNNNTPRNVIAPRNDDQRGGRNDNDRRRQEEMHGNRQRPRQRRQTRPEKVYEKSERRLNEPGPTYILGIDRTFANQDEFWKKLANLPKTINLTVKSFKRIQRAPQHPFSYISKAMQYTENFTDTCETTEDWVFTIDFSGRKFTM